MAEYQLIDAYLGELGRSVGRIRHAEEILEEVADHLLEAVAMQTRRGLDLATAQRRALHEFGDPDLVGSAFASSLDGGIAVPTQFTKRAGVGLVVSSALWMLGFAGLFWSSVLDRTRPWEGMPQVAYTIGATGLGVAAILYVIGIAALNRRHGGTLGAYGRAAFWLGIPTAFVIQAAWAWGVWSTGFAIVGILLALGLTGAGLAPRPASILIGLGALLTPAVLWMFQLSGTDLSLGDGPATVGVIAGVAIFAAGLFQVGQWLRSEVPVDEPNNLAAA